MKLHQTFKKKALVILIAFPTLCHTASSSSDTQPSDEGPSLFWNPILYWQKAITDPASELGHKQIDHISHEMTQNVLPCARINLEQAGNGILDHASHELTTHVLPSARVNVQQAGEDLLNHAQALIHHQILPQAELHARQITDHATLEFKNIMKSSLLACCWIGVAFFGAKLAYENIKNHTGEIKSKETVKATIGIASIILALYAVYTQFE